jgi:hypothetical protein
MLVSFPPEKLAAVPPVVNPVKELIAAALDGRATPDKVDRALERAAQARLIASERVSLDQRIEPELTVEFGKRLENGAADAVLDLLRPQFDRAATALGAALTTVGVCRTIRRPSCSPRRPRSWPHIRASPLRSPHWTASPRSRECSARAGHSRW